MKLAGAPISWGVCEVPDWGHQLSWQRVLAEMRQAGLTATELGPPGFLPSEPAALKAALGSCELALLGGFSAVVLHLPERRPAALAELAQAARSVAAAGGAILLVAAACAEDGYDSRAPLSAAEWSELELSLSMAQELAAEHGLELAFHPHVGTPIQTRYDVVRLLERSAVGLCLDTGHLSVGGADPVEMARLAGRRVRHVHLKDVNTGLAEQVRSGRLLYGDAVRQGLYRPLGEGGLDLASVLAVLSRFGYEGWYVLEQDTALRDEPAANTGPVLEAGLSVRHFQRLAGGVPIGIQ